MANKKPIVLYNGEYSLLKNEDNILDKHSNSISIRAESLARIESSIEQYAYYTIFRDETNVGSGQFYYALKSGNHTYPSGNWSGWPGAKPFIVPFNCEIIRAHINFSYVAFNWRNTPGNIFLDVGFLDHNYNTTFNERILRFEINGSFTGGNSGQSGFRYIVGNGKIVNILGNNQFNEGELIGCLLRTGSPNIEGRINSISHALHEFVFRRIEL